MGGLKMKEKLKPIAILTLLAMSMVVAANAVTVIDDAVSSFTGTLTVTPVDASTGLTIDQNYNDISLDIDSEATSAAIIRGVGVYNTFVLGHPTSSNGANYFYRDDVAANTNGPVVFIEQDNAGDDQNALTVQQDGSGMHIQFAGTAFAGCDAGDYGLYQDSSNDLYWCKNGVSTKLN
jgi:hypothetical protein